MGKRIYLWEGRKGRLHYCYEKVIVIRAETQKDEWDHEN